MVVDYTRYLEKINFYLNNRKYFGDFEDYDLVFILKSSVCGDINELKIKLDGSDKIFDICYTQMGCGLNIACLEILCETVIGNSLDIFKSIDLEFFKRSLDFPDSKIHCVSLIIDLLRENGY